MTTYLVSRHQGAVQWVRAQGWAVDEVVPHLDPDIVGEGDRVIGTLPVHLAAAVCARGGRYYHLELDLPPDKRGAELTPGDMNACGARVREYRVLPGEREPI
jgi:CRISPR-associated protein Csx16